MYKLFVKNLFEYFMLPVAAFIGMLFLGGHIVHAGEMNMHTINVGRGDAILIESMGHYMLVDSGTADGTSLLMDYLHKMNIPDKKIDYIISTHPDEDHVGGFSAVLQEYSVGQVFYSPCTKASSHYYSFIQSVKAKGCPFRTPVEEETWMLGDAKVQVVYDGSQGSTYNECSIVLRVTCDKKSILLTGDLPSTIERFLLTQGYNFKADILKVGHHGASASSCANFLDAVNPSYAVISCNIADAAILPKPSVLMRLARRFVKTYRTTDGDVVFNIKDNVIHTKNKENNGYISIKKGKIILSNNLFYATGKAIKPDVTLYVNNVLVPSSQYTVKYYSNTKTGVATVRLTATEAKYVSVCITTFLILPRQETVKSSLSGLKTVKLFWSYQSAATGYTIIYSTDKTFKTGLKYLTFKNPKTLSCKISELDYNTKYYFKVRAYKSNVGYGQWSKAINVKTKPFPMPEQGKLKQPVQKFNGKILLKWKKQPYICPKSG